jgi:hypothetical protein
MPYTCFRARKEANPSEVAREMPLPFIIAHLLAKVIKCDILHKQPPFLSKFSAKYKLVFRKREYNGNRSTYLNITNPETQQEQ